MEYVNYKVRLLHEIFKQGFRTPDWRHREPPPVVSLEYFFEGNPQQYSIAPNLTEDHPGLNFFYKHLKNIRSRTDVKEVWVNIYDLSDVIFGDEDGWPQAENVHILTSTSDKEREKWEKVLLSDAIIYGWPYGKAHITQEEDDSFKWWCVCWD